MIVDPVAVSAMSTNMSSTSGEFGVGSVERAGFWYGVGCRPMGYPIHGWLCEKRDYYLLELALRLVHERDSGLWRMILSMPDMP